VDSIKIICLYIKGKNTLFPMRVISQNIANYGIDVPKDAVFRVNLAWCSSINELKNILEKYPNNDIFLDLPKGRVKPPNNKYSLDDLIPVILAFRQIKFMAISNIESSSDLEIFIKKIPNHVILVPKIESPTAIKNISDIVDVIPNTKKILMLDHDDLFSQIIKNKEPIDNFKNYIQKLVDYCDSNKIILLRTIGVMFSDEEKRISEYIK